ncbi:MAG: hypothetical protein FWG36_09035 [Oscillospiraceae bacterium]|nr:hypothetical protein [Oscillospiraceae bacterium]
MYTKLFNAITDAISALQTAQQITEEIYMSSEEATLVIASPTETNENYDS